MIYGDNYVEVYTPVEAYSVNSRSARVVSGPIDDDITVSSGMVFHWVYDENGTSGFTGGGWFAGTTDPSWTPVKHAGYTNDEINSQFANNTRSNLNDIFQNWQSLVAQDAGLPGDFAKIIPDACWDTVS